MMIRKELRTTVCYGCQKGYINSFSVRKKLNITVFRKNIVNSFTIRNELRTTVFYGCQKGYVNSSTIGKELRTTILYTVKKTVELLDVPSRNTFLM